MSQKIMSDIVFNNKLIPNSQIFLLRKNVFGLINHKPSVQGHVLVCCRRSVPKLSDLTEIEAIDMFVTAQEVSKKLQVMYNTQYDLTLQNGQAAGQTVFQCHIHLYPKHGSNKIQNRNRQPRNENQMAKQAEKYRGMFQLSLE